MYVFAFRLSQITTSGLLSTGYLDTASEAHQGVSLAYGDIDLAGLNMAVQVLTVSDTSCG